MLRLFVLILVLANAVYFAWSDGLLRDYGFGPTSQREPQRIAQQLHPEALRVLTPAELKQAEALAQAELAPKECLQAGPFDDAQASALRRLLESNLGSTGWQLDAVTVAPRWIIYIGKFSSSEAMNRRRHDLQVKQVTAQAVTAPALEPGLSLGAFETQSAAATELARLNQRGVRSAKVVQERKEGSMQQLKLPAVSEAMKPRLNDLKPALAGHTLVSCK